VPSNIDGSAGAVEEVARPELGRQQMAAAERVQGKIAVAVVIAVEEPAFLMAVQRVVGGVEVENDLFGRPCMRLEEEVDEQGFDRRRVMADFVIARGERTGEFEPIERRLARERRANPSADSRACPPASPSASGIGIGSTLTPAHHEASSP